MNSFPTQIQDHSPSNVVRVDNFCSGGTDGASNFASVVDSWDVGTNKIMVFKFEADGGICQSDDVEPLHISSIDRHALAMLPELFSNRGARKGSISS